MKLKTGKGTDLPFLMKYHICFSVMENIYRETFVVKKISILQATTGFFPKT